MKFLEVESDGKRIDAYLSEKLEDMSRVTVQRLLSNGKILVNHKIVKSSYKVQEGDNIKVEEGIVYITIDGNTSEFDLDACETIAIEDIEGTKNCEVIVNPDTDSEVSFEVPSIMKIVVKGFASSNDIEIVE